MTYAIYRTKMYGITKCILLVVGIRDTLVVTYKRTEFTCIRCGVCWSCHWMVEQTDKCELSATSGLIQLSDESIILHCWGNRLSKFWMVG